METKTKFDLESRLIDFAVKIIKVTETMSPSMAGNHLAGQLVRSGTAPALLYGEAQSAESRRDFIHKIRLVLKELRESQCSLQIILKAGLSKKEELVRESAVECRELVAIFTRSADTAKKNLLAEK